VNVRNDTAASDGGLDKRVQLLISTNGELQVARSDTFHFQILASIACKLENFSSEVFKDCSSVYGSGGSNTLSEWKLWRKL
jgi:hypothetical protein